MPASPQATFTGLNQPAGIAVDAAGKKDLTGQGSVSADVDYLTTYNSDGSQTTPTITGLSIPGGVAVDAAGKPGAGRSRNASCRPLLMRL